ncbi:hypothetical protein [Asticcacaulis sp. 201]|uniref:hypothetical protein n=1 Tax=Asticcacaulis sp. 201 TaxID=3028787 RepID=UPI002915F37D|nr:hypothetical protein [Asticcacaulis sp. 201]MDV6331744.1 hypothetical protein [Asticcacaulis sp. 201]
MRGRGDLATLFGLAVPALIDGAETLFSLDTGTESLSGLGFLLIPPFYMARHVCVDHRAMEASQPVMINRVKNPRAERDWSRAGWLGLRIEDIFMP